MEITISAADIEAQWPGSAVAMTAILARKTANPGCEPKFKLSYALQIGGRQPDSSANEAEVARWAEKITSWVITASSGRFKTLQRPSRELPADAPFPREILAAITGRRDAEIAEKARVDALSPEQRAAETDNALRQLRGAPGFRAYNIPAAALNDNPFRDAPGIMTGKEFLRRLTGGKTEENSEETGDIPDGPKL